MLKNLDTYYTPIESEESQERANEVTDLIGVLYGIKPTAFLDFVPFRDDQASIYETIGKLGIIAVTVPITPCSSESELVIVSYDAILAHEAAAAALRQCGRDDDDADRRLGRLLGYPATATEYYLKRRATIGTPHELPTCGTTHINRHFAQFVLSPDNLEEEMRQYAHPLARAVKRAAPETYRRVIN